MREHHCVCLATVVSPTPHNNQIMTSCPLIPPEFSGALNRLKSRVPTSFLHATQKSRSPRQVHKGAGWWLLLTSCLFLLYHFFFFLVFYQLNPVAYITMTDNLLTRMGNPLAAGRTYCLRTDTHLLPCLSPAFLRKLQGISKSPWLCSFPIVCYPQIWKENRVGQTQIIEKLGDPLVNRPSPRTR